MPKPKKGEQNELPGYKPTRLEVAFKELVDARNALNDAQELLKQKKEAMLTAMDEADKAIIVKDGFVIEKKIKSAKIDIKIKEV